MDYTLRATRFPLKLLLRYRESGTIPWHTSYTENISRTGILFRAGQDIPIQTALEIHIEFPMFLNLTLICRGPVVRNQGAASPETPILAAVIRACRFLPNRSAKNST
jgi:hypothetical protein